MLKVSALAIGVEFSDVDMTVALADGRTITAPLEWFPRLLHASPSQRNDWRLIGSGLGMAWDEIDEDISVAGLLAA